MTDNNEYRPNFYTSLRHSVETLGNLARETADTDWEKARGLFHQRDAVLAALRTVDQRRTAREEAESKAPMDRYSNMLEAEVQKRIATERELKEAEVKRANECHRQLLAAERRIEELEALLAKADEKPLTYDQKKQAFERMFDGLPPTPAAEDSKADLTDLSEPHPDQHLFNELAFGASDEYLCRTLIDVAEGEPVTHMKSALLAAAADRLGVDVFPSDATLKRRRITKGELAEALYPEHKGYRFDCALPQTWVNDVDKMLTEDNRAKINASGGVAWNFVVVYSDECPHGCIMPITRLGVGIMSAIACSVR